MPRLSLIASVLVCSAALALLACAQETGSSPSLPDSAAKAASPKKRVKDAKPIDPAVAAARGAARAAAQQKLDDALLTAVEDGDVARARQLLAKKADPNVSDKHK